MSRPLPERGRLEDLSFPELLKRLHDGAVTGTLALRQGSVLRSVYFEEGRLVFARSTNPNDRLGEFLLRRGVIGLRHYLESSTRIEPGKRQGAVLCELGAISADELVKCVTEQVTEILFSLFPWETGTYELRRGAHDQHERIVLSLPIEDVILGGVRRVTDWGRIWRGLDASLHAVFAPAAGGQGLAHRATLTDDEAHVLSVVNGKLELGRILEVSYVSNFETCRILWGFRVLGAIERVTSGVAAAAPAEDYALAEMVEDFDRLLTFVYGFVTERIGDLVDHFMDRAIRVAQLTHGGALADVHLRNQGRVEYEQIFANLSAHRPEERFRRAEAALTELVAILLDLTARELGDDEESSLRDHLRLVASEIPHLPIEPILARASHRATRP